MIDFSTSLNESQLQAVEYCSGPQLVIAGAGSGKTRVLTYKIAYLLEHGLKPWHIVALTFTNKAANEMKERIANLVGQEQAQRLRMGTFHSIFSRILRVEAEAIGYQPNFTIYDEADSRSLLKTIIKELNLDDKIYRPAAIHARISNAKNKKVSAAEYNRDTRFINRDEADGLEATGGIFLEYEKRCRTANAMDFDDLLTETWRLFNEHEDIRRKYVERLDYLLVDEYQDTNSVQQQIVLQLTRDRRRVCVVGDDAQSIYGFRGANIDNILDFQKIYPDCKLFKLERNYRSTQNIVNAANSLIKHNVRQIQKDVYSKNSEGERLRLIPCSSDREEAMVVCKQIERLRREDHCGYDAFAVLYRTNAQSRSFEEEMLKRNIPYQVFGGQSFYQRKEIKDIVAYFRLVVNQDDEEAFKRIINYPARGIGNTTQQKVAAMARERGLSFWDAISPENLEMLNVTSATKNKLAGFQHLISTFMERRDTADVYTLGKEIITNTGISKDIYSGNAPEDLSRQENLQEFMSSMQAFVQDQQEAGEGEHVLLEDYLQQISLLTDLDSDDTTQSKVRLMTVHAAKGLEFPTVFVVGLEDEIFPSARSMQDRRLMEEERRLLYVAITRAEHHCFLTYAESRYRYGRLEMGNPSCFLGDIDSQFIDRGGYAERGMRNADPIGGWDVPRSAFRNPHYQNNRPVASQFRADPQPKITRMQRPEPAVNPFSDSFRRRLEQEGGRMRRIDSAITNGGRSKPLPAGKAPLHEGNVIEHQRFGRGRVTKVEGEGENTKATVDFDNAGTKQLLLKFARYTIIG